MILGIHLVWTCYGWWFPNDVRGSWSKEVWSPEMREFGEIEARGRRAVQPAGDRLRKYISTAQKRLKHKPVELIGRMRQAVTNAIMQQARLNNYVIMALAVMPRHVHTVVRRHDHAHGRIVRGFKAVSSREVRKLLAASFTRRDSYPTNSSTKRIPVWSKGYWARFLNTDPEITAAVAYVKRHDCASS